MSSATTSSSIPSPEVPVAATVPPLPAIDGAFVLNELALLRAEVLETRERLSQLESQLPLRWPSRTSPLFAVDSPAMEFAKQLCAEIFPGPMSIEVACAPDDPTARWYVFFVFCAAEMKECLDREVQFGLRLHDAFPEEAGDIRLAVSTP